MKELYIKSKIFWGRYSEHRYMWFHAASYDLYRKRNDAYLETNCIPRVTKQTFKTGDSWPSNVCKYKIYKL